MKDYAYYPGCSVKGTGRHYEESLLAAFDALGLNLLEIDDWNCCGATLYMSVDEMMSFTLSSRNLALAEKMGHDIVTPCSACYLVLIKTQDFIRRYPEIKAKIDGALKSAGMEYKGKVRVRHPLEVLINDMGLEDIKKKVTRPLKGIRVAPYYGCQLVRPYHEFDHPIYPTTMDRLLEALGAEVVDYPLKTRCCGGSLTGTIENVGLRLNQILLNEAQKRGANCLVTVCPLCQFNLECYQTKINKRFGTDLSLPILYFTQLLGLAVGVSKEELGFKRAMVPADSILVTA